MYQAKTGFKFVKSNDLLIFTFIDRISWTMPVDGSRCHPAAYSGATRANINNITFNFMYIFRISNTAPQCSFQISADDLFLSTDFFPWYPYAY